MSQKLVPDLQRRAHYWWANIIASRLPVSEFPLLAECQSSPGAFSSPQANGSHAGRRCASACLVRAPCRMANGPLLMLRSIGAIKLVHKHGYVMTGFRKHAEGFSILTSKPGEANGTAELLNEWDEVLGDEESEIH
jgi:hypothetical protein